MRRTSLFALVLCLSMLMQAQPLKRTTPESVGMSSALLHNADAAIQASIDAGEIPGAVLAVVRHGKMAYIQAYGNRQVYPTKEAMTTETIFDMASCSKCMGTTMSVMKLLETGRLRLLDAVNRYIPDFEDWQPKEGGGKVTIRIEDLLTHTPKTDFQYSCLNFITLQNVVEKITGQSLRDFARENIFGPLQMNHTDYLPCAPDANGVWKNTADPVWASLMPGQDWRSIVAPTTKQEDGSVLRGMVHDPLARLLNGGISGNTGVFSNADDIAILCAALLNGGEWNGVRVLSPLTVEAMRSVPRSVSEFGRTLGWDCFSPYASNNGDLFSRQTFSHTGFTGTSIVIDPENDCAVILLVNAVHPEEGRGGMIRLRSVVSNAVAGSIVKK